MKKKKKPVWLFKLHRYGRRVGMITAWLSVITFLNYFIIKLSKYMAAQTLTVGCPAYTVCIF